MSEPQKQVTDGHLLQAIVTLMEANSTYLLLRLAGSERLPEPQAALTRGRQ
jgi:hypothetical protein